MSRPIQALRVGAGAAAALAWSGRVREAEASTAVGALADDAT